MKRRLVAYPTFVAVLALSATALTHLLFGLAEAIGLRLTVVVFETQLFQSLEEYSGIVRSTYHFANVVVYGLFVAVARQAYAMVRNPGSGTRGYKTNTRRLIAIATTLSAAEAIRALVQTVVLKEPVLVSSYASYAAIACLFVIAYVMLRGVETRTFYDGSV